MNVTESRSRSTVRHDADARIMRPMPEETIDRLADLWCEALLANLRRHPVSEPLKRAS